MLINRYNYEWLLSYSIVISVLLNCTLIFTGQVFFQTPIQQRQSTDSSPREQLKGRQSNGRLADPSSHGKWLIRQPNDDDNDADDWCWMQVEVDAESGEPFDTLTPVALDWCRSVGCNLTKVSDIIDYSNETVCVCVSVCVCITGVHCLTVLNYVYVVLSSSLRVFQLWAAEMPSMTVSSYVQGAPIKKQQCLSHCTLHPSMELSQTVESRWWSLLTSHR